jgi:AcrR family transcriptional regulator
MTATAPTRERLLAAARQVIEEGGYGAATVAVIAERAGVASGTLYRHFASKEELFVELFRAVCDREVAAMQAAAAAMPAGASHVDVLVEVLSTFAACWPSRSTHRSTPIGSRTASATAR